MSRREIDLSQLPLQVRERLDQLAPDVRERLLSNLARVPPKLLSELLQRGSPVVEKLIEDARKHLGWYARDRPENTRFRAVVNQAETAAAQLQLTRDYFDRLEDGRLAAAA